MHKGNILMFSTLLILLMSISYLQVVSSRAPDLVAVVLWEVLLRHQSLPLHCTTYTHGQLSHLGHSRFAYLLWPFSSR